MGSIRVVIIDKQPFFRAGVKQAFSGLSDFEILRQAQVTI